MRGGEGGLRRERERESRRREILKIPSSNKFALQAVNWFNAMTDRT